MPRLALSSGPDHSGADNTLHVTLTYIGNDVSGAAAFLLVYEWITSLDDEISHGWPCKWGLPKFIFLLNRYVIRLLLVYLWIVAELSGTSGKFCYVYGYWQIVPLPIAILVAQALIVIRLWAIYEKSRRMFWCLISLYTLEVVVVVMSMVVAIIDTHGVAQLEPLTCGLISRSGHLLPRFASVIWIAPACFEFIILVITLAKAGRAHNLLKMYR
ncbi:hypothetical protein B0H10DRAFT_2120582 [Mycena sp. CBHHK59/15]|nr:hypothetical protein B0H10DRAFT_2120582 [Mycena sp. CBHHK59/15]